MIWRTGSGAKQAQRLCCLLRPQGTLKAQRKKDLLRAAFQTPAHLCCQTVTLSHGGQTPARLSG